jgi:tRNA (guanine-N7-)-methyltransferase
LSPVVTASDLGVPLDAARVFGREGPLVLEVGFGNGEFLEYLADRHSEWNILGADTSPSCVVRARRRVGRGGFSNVRLYCGDARYIVRNVTPRSSLFRVYVNFPDPWPRRRHARRRLMGTEFLTLLASRLADDGALWLTTDHPKYFDFARASIASTGLYSEEIGPPPAETLETRWARRWLEQERPIHHALFHKTVEPASVPSRLDIVPMQHALVRGDLANVTHFEKTVYRRKGATIVLTEASRSVDGSSLLFQVMVDEDDLSQHALVEARARESDILVGVANFGRPLSTRGLNEAVVCVAEYLAGCGFEIVEDRM